jgi:hypothetical protein
MVGCGSVSCRSNFKNVSVSCILYFLLFEDLFAIVYSLSIELFKAVSRCGNGENNEWRPVEAALFCIRAISNYVSVVEAEVMPQVWCH